MSILSNRKSYAETVEGRRRVASRLGVLLLVFLSFELIGSVFMAAFSVSSSAMRPSLYPGDLVLVSPLLYGPETVFGKLPPFSKPQRGGLVIVRPPYTERPGFWAAAADAFVRFVTFQRLSIVGKEGQGSVAGPFIERVIALPGDTVKMEDFVFMVKQKGSQHFLTEFELSSLRYDIEKPVLPEGWATGYPLSGSMAERVLGKEEYFVAGDNRGASSDSRFWGAIGLDRFKALVFLRYWPFSRFGAL